MKNDDLPVGEIVSRRQAIVMAAQSGFCLVAGRMPRIHSGSRIKPKVDLVASPALEEGPFFVDEKLNRSNLLAGATRASVVKGVPLELKLTVHQLSGEKVSPAKGWQVDVWHCDAAGAYSDEESMSTEGQAWLRGFQTTDDAGAVKFQTIVPGWYPGRTTHIHIKLRKFSERHAVIAEFTSQLFFHEPLLHAVYAKPPYSGQAVPAGTNLRDHIFAQRQVDGSVAGTHLQMNLQKTGDSFASEFAIVLSDRSFSAAENPRLNRLMAWDQF